jgi:hypothetical protein
MIRRQTFLSFACGLLAVCICAPAAQAIPPFMKEFQAKYAKPDSENEQEKAFAAVIIETAKCNVCHVQGEPKKARNAYGTALSKLLKKGDFGAERLKTEPEKATAEIVAAFDAIAAEKSAGDGSPTFGELLAQFKLPGDAPAAEETKSEPMPEPMPEPASTAPAPAEGAAPTSDTAMATAEIGKIGGTVMQLAQNDDSLVVDFHLGGTALTNDGLAQVKALPKVVELNLKDTQITDEGLVQIAGMGSLVRLHLEQTKVTDAGLVHLKDLGNLEYLNLYGTAVTDAGLEHLKSLAKLKKLFVWQTQVTDEGIAKLKEALPEVTVVK